MSFRGKRVDFPMLRETHLGRRHRHGRRAVLAGMDVTFDCSYIAGKHHHDLPQIGSCIETASGSEIYKLAGSCGRFEGVRMQRASFSIEGHAPNREETPDELGD